MNNSFKFWQEKTVWKNKQIKYFYGASGMLFKF